MSDWYTIEGGALAYRLRSNWNVPQDICDVVMDRLRVAERQANEIRWLKQRIAHLEQFAPRQPVPERVERENNWTGD